MRKLAIDIWNFWRRRRSWRGESSLKNLREQGSLPFFLGMIISFLLIQALYKTPDSSSSFALFSLILSLTYPLWRERSKIKSPLKSILTSFLATYWFYEGFFRVAHSVMISFHFFNHKMIVVNSSKALLGASPFFLISLAFILDFMFERKVE